MTYWVEDSNDSGVILWLQTSCGFKQAIVRWPDVGEAKRFAEMLLHMCTKLQEKREMHGGENDTKVREISDQLLRQALGNEE